ncbi:MAG: stage II sporulation protein M [Candidatus Micrarchaeaceae archaeon]
MPYKPAHHSKRPSIFDRQWERTALLLFIAEVAVLLIFSAVPLPTSVANVLSNNYQALKQQIAGMSFPQAAGYIFAHNLEIATGEMLPLLGGLLLAVSVSSTGLTLSAISHSYNIAGVAIGASLFILPHTWIELSAYAFASTEGLFLLLSLIKWKKSAPFMQELNRAASAWLLVAATLLVAAIFESGELQLGMSNSAYPLLAWLPFIAVIAAAAEARRRLKTRAGPLNSYSSSGNIKSKRLKRIDNNKSKSW